MMGDASPIGVESGGFDDVEFDHWMRVAQARSTRSFGSSCPAPPPGWN